MDRYWLLTWRTYGTWLPGDERGFVDPVIDEHGNRVIHNLPGTPLDADSPGLKEYACQIMRGPAVTLTQDQGRILLQQLQETAHFRGWQLLAVAILVNHVHLVVGVIGDPDPATLLRDFKSYGSRSLNRAYGIPRSGTWWAESGSRRVLKTEEGILAAIAYVLQQGSPLVTWQAATEGGERPAR